METSKKHIEELDDSSARIVWLQVEKTLLTERFQ